MNLSGIYKIENKVNNKVYIGSSKNINTRWGQHKNMLNNNKHHSIKLQRAWNKYGEANFIFEVIEECDIEKLLYLEQFYIDKYKSYYEGYNSKENTKDIYTIDDYIKDEENGIICEFISKFINLFDVSFSDKSIFNRLRARNIKSYEKLYIVDIINFILENVKDTDLVIFKNNNKRRECNYLEFDSDKLKDIHFSIIKKDSDILLNFIYFFDDRNIFYIDEKTKDTPNTNVSEAFIGKVFYQRDGSIKEYNDEYMKFIKSMNPFNIREVYEIKYGCIDGFMDRLDYYYKCNNIEYGTILTKGNN